MFIEAVLPSSVLRELGEEEMAHYRAPFDSPETAIRYANGTDYGLVSGVFTQQLDQALWFSKRLRSGQVFINEWFAGGVETPFGGYGKSGYGREKGREALLNYVQTKNIAFRITR